LDSNCLSAFGSPNAKEKWTSKVDTIFDRMHVSRVASWYVIMVQRKFGERQLVQRQLVQQQLIQRQLGEYYKCGNSYNGSSSHEPVVKK
jgi:hypothetical protein